MMHPSPSIDDQNSELAQLREVLAPKPHSDVETLRNMLESDERLSKRLAEVMPKIFNPQDKDNKKLPHSMQSSVLDSLSFACAAEPKRVAQVLSPALLPAINHAIAQTLLDFRASVDEMIRNYLSPKGLLWRFQSWRTGESFSKIARHNTASFGIEAVVFVHKQTKELVYTQYTNSDIELLLRKHDVLFKTECIQLASTATITESGAQVTAHKIRLHTEDLRIYAAHGAWLTMLVMYWGEAPTGFTEQMVSILHRAHSQNHHELSTRRFGNEQMTSLTMPANVLVKVAGSADSGVKINKPIGFMIFAGLILAALSVYVWQQWQWNTERKVLEQYLAKQPSWVSNHIQRQNDTWQVQGMLDQQLLTAKQISDAWLQHSGSAHALQIQATPYASLDNQAILQRAHKLLSPPQGIGLVVENGVLTAQGTLKASDKNWLSELNTKWPYVMGVTAVDSKGVKVSEDALGLPPLTHIEFAKGAELSPEGDSQLTQWMSQWRSLPAESSARNARLHILARNSAEGSAGQNEQVRRARYELIRAKLVAAGVLAEHIEYSEDTSSASARAVEIQVFKPSP